jgi:hypothetical protein
VAAYRVVCVEWQIFDDGHRHIVAIGTGDDPRKAEERWTMTEVLFSVRFGQDRFTPKTPTADRLSGQAICDCGPHPRIGGRRDRYRDALGASALSLSLVSHEGRVARSLSVDDLGLVVAVGPQDHDSGMAPFRCMRYSSRKKGMPKTQNA